MFFSFSNLDAFALSENSDAMNFILGSTIMLLSKGNYIFLITGFLFILFFILFYKQNRNIKNDKRDKNRYVIGIEISILSMILMGTNFELYRSNCVGTYFDDNNSSLYGSENCGILNYYIFDFFDYQFGKEKTMSNRLKVKLDDKLEAYTLPVMVSPVDNSIITNSDNYGIYNNKNLLLIQMESINNFLIGLKIVDDNKTYEVMPNLNDLVSKSIYFNNFYTNVGIGNTSDAEFSVMTGLYPEGDSLTTYHYADNNIQTLPKMFENLGYYTYSLHANSSDFYNRKEVFENFYGFSRFYGKEDLKTKELIHGWLSDEEFLYQTIDIMKEESKQKPTFAYAISISNHMPYELPVEGNESQWFNNQDNLFPSKITLSNNSLINNQIIGYLEHAHYFDNVLGNVIKYLDKVGLSDNTILCLYGDHGCGIDITTSFIENKDKYSNKMNDITLDYTNPLLERQLLSQVPFIIYDSNNELGIKRFEVRGLNSILRTLANLYGLTSQYYFGIDALSDTKCYVYNPRNLDIYADGIIISGQSKEFLVTGDEYINFYTSEQIRKIINSFYEYKDFNDKVLKYEIFPTFSP